jgi:hypothetical protein
MARLGSTFSGLVLFKTVSLDGYFRGWRRGAKWTFRSGSGLVAEFRLHLPELFLKAINPLLLFQTAAADVPA